MPCYVVIQGFKIALCSILGFADARPPVFWVTTGQSNHISGWRAIASPRLAIKRRRRFSRSLCDVRNRVVAMLVQRFPSRAFRREIRWPSRGYESFGLRPCQRDPAWRWHSAYGQLLHPVGVGRCQHHLVLLLSSKRR